MRYISGSYTQSQLRKDINEIELALTERFESIGAITSQEEQEKWKNAITCTSFGMNTVIFDDLGYPSIMVKIPLTTQKQTINNGKDIPHPAFVVNGIVKPYIYVAKYQCFVVGSGSTARAVSLKNKAPQKNINFNDANLSSIQKGNGWHLNTNATWSAIALDSFKKGFLPRGNNSYGGSFIASNTEPTEKGIPVAFDNSNRSLEVLSGSGAISWSHNGTPYGIFDLNGNLGEFVSGIRLNGNGEINIIPDNNSVINNTDFSSTSTSWKAILLDGTLVAPNTENTLKFSDTMTIINGSSGILTNSRYTDFKNITSQLVVPDILKLLSIYPNDSTLPNGNRCNVNTGERLCIRGGAYDSGNNSGVFSLNLANERSWKLPTVGFRTAFIK